MLSFKRKNGQGVVLTVGGLRAAVYVYRKDGALKIAVDAPPEVTVLRTELEARYGKPDEEPAATGAV
jgi:sRNA-binding carbon storage regulator CsrA